MSGKLVFITIAIAIPLGAAADYVAGDLNNQGRLLANVEAKYNQA